MPGSDRSGGHRRREIAPEDTPPPADDRRHLPEAPTRRTRRHPPDQRPKIEVRHVDGSWCTGRLHAWIPVEQGWRAVVSYHGPSGQQHYTWLPAGDVRPDPGEN
jgi:hypothetical protein